jgi:F0F1-type ATP synthase membrane subunit c/vacuolar-type H+-ATPase subunit K
MLVTGSTLFQKAGEAITGKGLGIGATILGGSALMSSLFGSPTDAAEAYSRNPSAVKSSYCTIL